MLCDELVGGMGRGGQWEKRLRRRGYMCTYGWFTLLYRRKQHNIVKQLYSKYK